MEKMFATRQSKNGLIASDYIKVGILGENIPNRSHFKIKRMDSLIKGTNDYHFVQDNKRAGWGYTSGWNGSYHDAHYSPMLYAWGKGKKKFQLANGMMQQAKIWAEEKLKEDASIAAFKARQQVREGD